MDDSGRVQVDRSYYAAKPAAPCSEVTVRSCDHDIEIRMLPARCYADIHDPPGPVTSRSQSRIGSSTPRARLRESSAKSASIALGSSPRFNVCGRPETQVEVA